MKADNTEGYGRIVRNSRGGVQRIVEEKDATQAQRRIRECNTGVLVSPARLLKGWLARLKADNSQREYYLTDVVAMAVKDRIAVSPLVAPSASEVLGVNDKAQLAELEGIWRARITRELMLAGITLADPARVDLRGSVTHGSDVFIDVNVVLEGKVALGDRVRVGAGRVIRDSEIGADTIVANHDGANKHRTRIEDDVHTGSNSVLVAPITVGAGATIAAGSTVTRAVPAGGLTVARARQVTLEKWRRPTKNPEKNKE